jgi:hypothetical protein
VVDRFGVVAAVGQQRRETLERVEVAFTEALALLQQPLVIGARQQVAGVGLDGLPQPRHRIALGQRVRIVQRGDVEPVRRVGAPAQRARADLEEAVCVGKRPPELVQHVAQVRPGLRLGRVGPQEERQPLARLRGVAMQEQVAEQRLGPRRLQRGERPIAETQFQLAEEADLERRRRRLLRALARPHRGQSARAVVPPSTGDL